LDLAPAIAAIDLVDLGWNVTFQAAFDELAQPSLEPARVAVEFGASYELIGAGGSFSAEAGGRLRHRAQNRSELPVVGDWVAVRRDAARPDAGARVEARLPRKSSFVRKTAGNRPEAQVVAANVDWVFVVTSANQDWNPRRNERYLAAVAESGASPVLVINKLDLCPDPEAFLRSLEDTPQAVPTICTSVRSSIGEAQLRAYLKRGVTIALVGTSGVGKSSIANWLTGRQQLVTSPIREHDDRGRHTTTHRELVLLDGGATLIDTPGMREFGLWLNEPDLDTSFADLAELAKGCRFADCQHEGQQGCALESAVASGQVDKQRLDHYRKLGTEVARTSAQLKPAARKSSRAIPAPEDSPGSRGRYPRQKTRR